MFEQSLLLPSVAPKRGRAFAASLTLQAAGISLLLLIPAIYTERLPAFHPQMPVLTFRVPGPIEEQNVVPRPLTNPKGSSLSSPRVFDPEQYRAGNTHNPMRDLISEIVAPEGVEISRDTVGPAIAIVSNLGQIAVAPPPPTARGAQAPSVPPVPVRVPSEIQAAKLIRKVVPEYPHIARLGRISGVVRLTGTIGRTGTVEQLQVVSGNPLLVKAALDAVRQWVYQPTILNGAPAEVVTSIDVVFSLAQ